MPSTRARTSTSREPRARAAYSSITSTLRGSTPSTTTGGGGRSPPPPMGPPAGSSSWPQALSPTAISPTRASFFRGLCPLGGANRMKVSCQGGVAREERGRQLLRWALQRGIIATFVYVYYPTSPTAPAAVTKKTARGGRQGRVGTDGT